MTRTHLIALAVLASVIAPPSHRRAAAQDAPTPGLSPEEAKQIAADAYVFAYPLVTMSVTERVSTNAVRAGTSKAPINQFANFTHYPEPSNHAVTAPNADTLYSTAWLDLSKEPIVFSHPDMGERFYMFPMLDAYTNVIRTPGARDDGGAAATYVLTGPGWKGGPLPLRAQEIKSPTNTVWILGRTYSTGTPEDYAKVHRLQAQYDLHPLSAGRARKPLGHVDPSVDEKTAVRNQVDAMTGEQFFSIATQMMGSNPPAPADAPIVERMARLGLVAGRPFDLSRLPATVAAAVTSAPKAGQDQIKAKLAQGGVQFVNGWMLTLKTGTYGTDYAQRALVTAIGLGANKPEQAVYPFAAKDSTGAQLDGSQAYAVHFAAGQMPPAKSFWSITMYTPQFFFFPNPMKRYTVSSRTHLHKNADGSVDVYFQHDKPLAPEQQANWLPAPNGPFVLMMRLYWPEVTQPSILDGSWKPPAVTPLAAGARTARTPARRH